MLLKKHIIHVKINPHITHIFGDNNMPQLHCYVPESTLEQLQQKAEQAHLSISKYLALLIKKDINEQWPEGV